MFCRLSLLPCLLVVFIFFVSAPQSVTAACGGGRYFHRIGDCRDCPCGNYCPEIAGIGRKEDCPAGKSSAKKQERCSTCRSGHWCPNKETCTGSEKACPAGTSFSGTGATSSAVCAACPIGHDSGAGSASCTPCVAGSFAAAPSTATCSLCDSSTYQSEPGQSGCMPVGAGFFSPRGAASKSMCVAGTWCAKPAGCADKCDDAQPGFYSPSANAVEQLPCTEGHHCPTAAMAQPIPCMPGFVAETVGRAMCDVCPAGTFSGPVASRCEECQPGFFAPEAAGFATKCPAGTMCDRTRCGHCSQCEPGTWQSETGQTLCRDSGPGFFTTGGRVSRTACPVGTWSDLNRREGPCAVCPAGRECATEGTVLPAVCLRGFYNPTGSITPCRACAPGTFANASESSRCFAAAAGFYVKNPTDQTPCPVDSFTNRTGAWMCERCRREDFTNRTVGATSCIPRPCCTPTFSVTETVSRSLSNTTPPTPTHRPTSTGTHLGTMTHDLTATADSSFATRSFSDDQNSSTVSQTLSSRGGTHTLTRSDDNHNSSSVSATVPPTRSKTASRTHLATRSHDETHTESLVATATHTPSDTARLSSTFDLFTESATTTATIDPPSQTDAASGSESVNTASRSQSQSRYVPPQPPIGLSAAAQAAIQTTTGVMSILTSAVAAPAAMTMLRGTGVMMLVGCPGRNPADKKHWQESRVPFPSSFLPGVGFDQDRGFFHRGSVLGFIVTLLVATAVGFLVLESTGKYQERDLEAVREEAAAERREKMQKEHEQNVNKKSDDDDLLGVNITDDGDRLVEEQQQQQQEEETETEEKERGELIAKRIRRVPQVLCSVTSSIIGLWAPGAGLLFATFRPLDMCLAAIPFIFIFVLHGYLVHRVRLSIQDTPKMRGLLFVASFVMQDAQIAAFKRAIGGNSATRVRSSDNTSSLFFMSQRERAALVLRDRGTWSYKLKRFLESSLGRYLALGNYFWTRPKGARGYEAQKLLTMLGNHMQKFRGPRCAVDFMETTNPFGDGDRRTGLDTFRNVLDPDARELHSDDYFSPQRVAEEERLDANLNSQAHRNAALYAESRDYEAAEVGTVKVVDKENWLAFIAPHQLYISWWVSLLAGFLTGIALAVPATCSTLIFVLAIINILSCILFSVMRPFVVEFRNHVMAVMELFVAVSGIIVLVFFHNNASARGHETLAVAMQITTAVVGNFGAFLLLVSGVVRGVAVKWFKLSIVSQEDLWVLSQVKMSELLVIGAGEERQRHAKQGSDSNNNETNNGRKPKRSSRHKNKTLPPAAEHDVSDVREKEDEEEKERTRRFRSMKQAGSTSQLRQKSEVKQSNRNSSPGIDVREI